MMVGGENRVEKAHPASAAEEKQIIVFRQTGLRRDLLWQRLEV
jgi:hypothetical protein